MNIATSLEAYSILYLYSKYEHTFYVWLHVGYFDFIHFCLGILSNEERDNVVGVEILRDTYIIVLLKCYSKKKIHIVKLNDNILLTIK